MPYKARAARRPLRTPLPHELARVPDVRACVRVRRPRLPQAAHGRIVWGVAWSSDDTLLATAARDNTVKLWRVPPQPSPGPGALQQQPPAQVTAAGREPALAATLPPFPCAATAVAFAGAGAAPGGSGTAPRHLLAVGLESGHVQLWRVDVGPAGTGTGSAATGVSASCVWASDDACRHAGTVNTLCWQESQEAEGEGEGEAGREGVAPRLRLASCSDDHSVRVFACRPGAGWWAAG